MAVREIKKDIYAVGAIDWDRRIFDELIHLPEGTSYNSYLIQGSEKTALIDSVYPPKTGELLENICRLNVQKIDYIIANHAEQDHSGSIPEVLKIYPDAMVVANQKCKEMLIDLLMISDDRFIVIKDGDILSLGNRTLEFIFAPWVHWPETMFTYLKEDKIIFTCDFLGAHLATSRLFAGTEERVMLLAKRYYAEVMMPFRTQIRKYVEKLKGMDIELIAPSHGPIYDSPGVILDAQADWASEEPKNLVLIPYTSMYKSTLKMVNFLVDELMAMGIEVRVYNMTEGDAGNLAIGLVDAATVVFATPTVLSGPHPNVIFAAFLTKILRAKVKFANVIGSYSWGSRAVEDIKAMLQGLKIEFLDPLLVKGYPKAQDFDNEKKLAQTILEKHRSIGIV